jgi:small-conductance mechanosensitive channel/CRP-like cAMP-binding protein
VSSFLDPRIALPAILVSLLALARLARLRPGLRPLLLPLVLTGGVLAVLLLSGQPRSSVAFLALAVPLLVLVVRGSTLLFGAIFERSQGTKAPELLESVVAVLLYLVGAGLIGHTWFGFELTPFLATSAVVGAVIGLALQETLGNLFAGISLHAEAPFRAGDWIKTEGKEGRVEQVSWRATRLRTLEGDTLTVPNSEVARHPILNYSVPPGAHSGVLQVPAGPQVPPNKVAAVLEGLLHQVPGLLRDPPPEIRVSGYTDAGLLYEVRYFVSSYEERRSVEREILRLVWYHFRRHGIAIPSPAHEVFLHTLASTAEEHPASRLEATLRSIDLFRPLDDGGLKMAAERFRRLHYAAGERIIQQGSPGDSFFIIDRGEVEVYKDFSRGPKGVARLAEGQFFGEMALLTGEPRRAGVRAITDVDLFTIEKRGFQEVLLLHPQVAEDISAILSERQVALAETGEVQEMSSGEGETPLEFKERLLARIRDYFGL